MDNGHDICPSAMETIVGLHRSLYQGCQPQNSKVLQTCGKFHFILLLSINDYPGTLDVVKVFSFRDQNDALLLIVDK